ncbi:MAG: hypothetical protein JO117_00845, partial [Verrucomicrobia bacterium]|nr:hypothetical protein [Verrucomicrobiota bacterium]
MSPMILPGSRPPRRRFWTRLPRAGRFAAKLLALFLFVAGAKLCLLRAAGSPLPFFDAWAGEGDTLLRPWLEGTWRWRQDLFAPFYQHRIALTRLFTL